MRLCYKVNSCPKIKMILDKDWFDPQYFGAVESVCSRCSSDIKVVAVSGGFDPIHIGHTRNIKEAKELGNYLIVILTRDDQLISKKNHVFMPYQERKEILEAIKWVDEVVENIDVGITSKKSLEIYHPDIFAKGGDSWNKENIPEAEICEELGIEIVFGVGGFEKVQSSSELTKHLQKSNVPPKQNDPLLDYRKKL